MSDARLSPEAPVSPEHAAIYRIDYRAPDWLVPEIALEFDLAPGRTRVRAKLEVARNGDHDRPLRLSGDGLTLLSVSVDGDATRWAMDGSTLVIEVAGEIGRAHV